MWFLNQFDVTSPAYNVPLAVRLDGDLDFAALQAAVADVLGRHESLRTKFPSIDGQPVQQGDVPATRSCRSWSRKSSTAARVSDRILELASAGFDASAEVPIRCAVLRVDGDERRHVLVIVVHPHRRRRVLDEPPRSGRGSGLRGPQCRQCAELVGTAPCSTATSLCGSTKCSAPRKIRTRL